MNVKIAFKRDVTPLQIEKLYIALLANNNWGLYITQPENSNVVEGALSSSTMQSIIEFVSENKVITASVIWAIVTLIKTAMAEKTKREVDKTNRGISKIEIEYKGSKMIIERYFEDEKKFTNYFEKWLKKFKHE